MSYFNSYQKSPKNCYVCGEKDPRNFLKINDKQYLRCNKCCATFIHPINRLTSDEEYNHYLTHQNDPCDLMYRNFLSKLLNPLLCKFGSHSIGLDYGCGPGSALAMMLKEKGLQVSLYDPFFEPHQGVLEKTYDFITCIEVVEHFYNPAKEFDRLNELLRPNGWLGVMTCFQTNDEFFKNWHYRKDPTHVIFYRGTTFDFIAKQRNWTCEIPAKDVALMQKA